MATTPPDNGFVTHCMELLAVLGPIRPRRMFGGHGLYADGVFVAIISTDQLYLKTDDQTRPRFEAAGCEPFRYERRGPDGKVTVAALGYYQPPEEALESPAVMAPWARMAMEAALRAANAKPSPKATKATKATRAVKPPAAKKAARSTARSATGQTKAATPKTSPSRTPGEPSLKRSSGAASRRPARKAG